jgi:hypothetical protein
VSVDRIGNGERLMLNNLEAEMLKALQGVLSSYKDYGARARRDSEEYTSLTAVRRAIKNAKERQAAETLIPDKHLEKVKREARRDGWNRGVRKSLFIVRYWPTVSPVVKLIERNVIMLVKPKIKTQGERIKTKVTK